MSDTERYPSDDAERRHDEAARLAYAAIALQAAIFESHRTTDTPTSAVEAQPHFQELARPLAGSVVEGDYDGRVYYHRGQRNERLARILPFGGGQQSYERSSTVRYAGIVRGIDVVRRSRTKPPILGLALDPVAADPDLAASHRRLGENKLHHPLGVYKYDRDETIWLPIRAVRRLVASRLGLESDARIEGGFLAFIRSRIPEEPADE